MTENTATTVTPPTLATAEELNDLRKRVLSGEEFPAEEYRKIIQAYRANRMGAVAAAAPKTKAKAAASAKATPQSLENLLGSLGL